MVRIEATIGQGAFSRPPGIGSSSKLSKPINRHGPRASQTSPYAISATVDGVLFSEPLILGTIQKPEGKFWGDVMGEFDGTGWTAPNGLVNVNDIIAWINFITFKPAPHITVLDLANEVPKFVINATDLTLILQGFQSKPYPPPAFPNQGLPTDCP